jgi:hypothetical protein
MGCFSDLPRPKRGGKPFAYGCRAGRYTLCHLNGACKGSVFDSRMACRLCQLRWFWVERSRDDVALLLAAKLRGEGLGQCRLSSIGFQPLRSANLEPKPAVKWIPLDGSRGW